MEREVILRNVLNVYGHRAQILVADVQIMLDQLYILFGKPRDWERRKLERLAHRLTQDA